VATKVSVTLADFLTPQCIALFRANGENFRQWAKDAGEWAGLFDSVNNPADQYAGGRRRSPLLGNMSLCIIIASFLERRILGACGGSARRRPPYSARSASTGSTAEARRAGR
jgi:hypothetical protein